MPPEDTVAVVLDGPAARPGAAPAPASDSDSRAAPGAASDSDSRAAPGAASDSDSQAAPGAASDSDSRAAPGAASDSDSQAAPSAASDSDSQAAPSAASDSDSQAAPGAASELPSSGSAPTSFEARLPDAGETPNPGLRSSSPAAAAVPASSGARRGLPEEAKAALGHPLVQDLLLNPTRWRLWPAMAMIRWLQRQMRKSRIRVVYRGRPTLSFPASEIADVSFVRPDELQIVVNALGLANAGSALPSADIARIIADYRSGGALTTWLDMVADRMLHAAEASVAQSVSPFACAMGEFPEADSVLPALVGHDGVLSESPRSGLSTSRWTGARRLSALGALFLGVPTAHGLARAFEGFTSLRARVIEFTGAPLEVSRPARLGAGFGRVLGARRILAQAGVTVRLNDGPTCEDAVAWASDPVRIRSLYELARAYIGDSSPKPSIELVVRTDELSPLSPGSRNALLGGCGMLNLPRTERTTLELRPL